jgi:hypothetical protein
MATEGREVGRDPARALSSHWYHQADQEEPRLRFAEFEVE